MTDPTRERPTIAELEEMLASGDHVELTPSGEVNRLSRTEWLERALDTEKQSNELLRMKMLELRSKLLEICDGIS